MFAYRLADLQADLDGLHLPIAVQAEAVQKGPIRITPAAWISASISLGRWFGCAGWTCAASFSLAAPGVLRSLAPGGGSEQ